MPFTQCCFDQVMDQLSCEVCHKAFEEFWLDRAHENEEFNIPHACISKDYFRRYKHNRDLIRPQSQEHTTVKSAVLCAVRKWFLNLYVVYLVPYSVSFVRHY